MSTYQVFFNVHAAKGSRWLVLETGTSGGWYCEVVSSRGTRFAAIEEAKRLSGKGA